MEYLGIQYESTGGDDEVLILSNTENSLMNGINYNYKGGIDAHFSVDHLANTEASVLYSSDDDLPRIFVNDPGTYKSVASSVIFGAFADADSLSVKTYFLAEIINYFLDIESVTALEEVINKPSFEVSTFPNPFTTQISINILNTVTDFVTVSIFDGKGTLICDLAKESLVSGMHTLTWNAADKKGNIAGNGVYFYRIITSTDVITRKIVLTR